MEPVGGGKLLVQGVSLDVCVPSVKYSITCWGAWWWASCTLYLSAYMYWYLYIIIYIYIIYIHVYIYVYYSSNGLVWIEFILNICCWGFYFHLLRNRATNYRLRKPPSPLATNHRLENCSYLQETFSVLSSSFLQGTVDWTVVIFEGPNN